MIKYNIQQCYFLFAIPLYNCRTLLKNKTRSHVTTSTLWIHTVHLAIPAHSPLQMHIPTQEEDTLAHLFPPLLQPRPPLWPQHLHHTCEACREGPTLQLRAPPLHTQRSSRLYMKLIFTAAFNHRVEAHGQKQKNYRKKCSA